MKDLAPNRASDPAAMGGDPAPRPERGSGWNYRVMRSVEPDGKSGVYQIHEVYYGPGGKVRNWTSEPVPVLADTALDMMTVFAMMIDALDHPILDSETGAEIEAATQLSDDLRRFVRFNKQDLFNVDFDDEAGVRRSLAAPLTASSPDPDATRQDGRGEG